ncbi:MAG TPA: glycosyltransferase [Rhodanobacteraceae bacterium]
MPATAKPTPDAAPTTFAVVISSYNYRDYVIEAIESVLAQTRAASQLVVVDDGSTDGSDALLRERYADDARITLVLGSNGGQLHALQRGMASVTADVVCFMDSDDRWKPDYLAKVGAIYDARTDVDFVFSDMQCFDQRQHVIAFHPRAIDLGYTALATFVLTVWYGVPTSAVSMRTAWARRVLDLPDAFREDWRTSPDNCLVYGASVLGARKYFLPTGSVEYRIHGKNAWSSRRSPEQGYHNFIKTRRLIAHYARVAGIDDTSCDIKACKLEYRTKPAPPWSETKRYARLIMMQRVWPAWKKWERAVSVLMHGWKSRRA